MAHSTLFNTLIFSMIFNAFPCFANPVKLPGKQIPKTERLKDLKGTEVILQKLEALPRPFDEETQSNIAMERQMLGFRRAFAGDTQGAIESYNLIFRPSINQERDISIQKDLKEIADATVQEAIAAIINEAKNRQVIILNESHHVPMHRAFAMVLARELRKIGYEYLACETFGPQPLTPLTEGFVTDSIGYYTNESMFANFLRDAIQMKWKFVDYEFYADRKIIANETRGMRETGEAKNLVERIFKNDPKAKVFIYVGYAHLYKLPEALTDADKSKMAAQLKRLTGVDPLTIDQTVMYQHEESLSQMGLYKAALEKSIENKPFVLKSNDNRYVVSIRTKSGIDMQVVHPAYAEDSVTKRPSWLASVAGFTPRDIPAEFLPIQGRRLIYAYPLNDPIDAVPADVVMVEVGKPVPKLMLPKGEYRFAFED